MLEPTQGRVIAELGDFGGIDRDGAPIGFLWSNSLVFRGDDVLVTNLALDLALDLGTAIAQLADQMGTPKPKALNMRTVDGPWAHDVKLHTVSKFRKWIPRVGDLHGVAH